MSASSSRQFLKGPVRPQARTPAGARRGQAELVINNERDHDARGQANPVLRDQSRQ